MLSNSNLHVTIGDKPIVKGLALAVPAGEMNGLFLSNGAEDFR
ncbi:hypothetical protein [Brevundimonas vitis]|nr:hypothetical protein [Brevundimonas vitisensis]